ncbi:hypothetical protein NDU88_004134 [Pleurodeles waltl]|uniref:Uncharacterized protein n=1 Tax=Pleurodeles waltl TaxID=8319 RepID=A0AAV7WVN8_PLEWA|nr:hypothetical protein NDU88_004134 [Pleurodeles waltl]
MQDQVLKTEGPIMDPEIAAVIKQLAMGRTLGSDGIPLQLFKTSQSDLTKCVLEVYETSRKQERLPQSSREEFIIMLPKPGGGLLDLYLDL